tara:strand:- start:5004 stop:5705 length:702 start_codon:yes stop_codon:yes gene_type:complete
MNNKQNILISSQNSKVSKIFAECLKGHNITYFEITDLDFSSSNSLEKKFSNIDLYIHMGYEGFTNKDPMKMIDYHTRLTYDLLFAAGRKNVPRVFSISSLELFENYESNLTITENWETDFSVKRIELLCAQLSENVCKEFARDKVFEVINLRIGNLFIKDNSYLSKSTLKNNILNLLEFDFAAQEKKNSENVAFISARKTGPNWLNLHLQDSFKGQKYLTTKIENLFNNKGKS